MKRSRLESPVPLIFVHRVQTQNDLESNSMNRPGTHKSCVWQCLQHGRRHLPSLKGHDGFPLTSSGKFWNWSMLMERFQIGRSKSHQTEILGSHWCHEVQPSQRNFKVKKRLPPNDSSHLICIYIFTLCIFSPVFLFQTREKPNPPKKKHRQKLRTSQVFLLAGTWGWCSHKKRPPPNQHGNVEKSPFLVGDVSSFMVIFSIVVSVFRGCMAGKIY